MIVICMALAVMLVISGIQQYAIYKQSRKRDIIGHDALTGLCNLDHLTEKTVVYRRDKRNRLVIYINIAKQLEMAVITEGIETKEQARGLSIMGCDYFQGYFFSKPISIECFEDRYVYDSADAVCAAKSCKAADTEVA